MLRVVNDPAPFARIVSPPAEQKITAGRLMVRVRAIAIDNIGIRSVAFLVNDCPYEVLAPASAKNAMTLAGTDYVPVDAQVGLGLTAGTLPKAYSSNAKLGADLRLFETDLRIPPGLYADAGGGGSRVITLGVRVTDVLGNIQTDYRPVEIIPDGAKPEVTLISPVPGGQYIEGTLFTVRVSAADDSYVRSIEVWNNVGTPFAKRVYFNDQLPQSDFFVGSANLVDTPPIDAQFRLPLLSDLGATSGDPKLVTYEVRVVDANGLHNEYRGSYNVIPDKKPIVNLLRPRPGSYVPEGCGLPISAEAFDDVFVDSVTFEITDDTGTTRFTDTAAPFDYSYLVPSANGGSIKVTAWATDSSGNPSDAQTLLVNSKVDYPPSIAISNPVNGQKLIEGRNILVQASAGDDIGVTAVTFYVDGEPVLTDTTAPFEMSWDVPYGRLAKPVVIGGVATDTAGKTTMSDQIRVNIVADTELPKVVFESPADNSGIVEGQALQVRAVATDNVAVSSVQFFLNGTPLQTDLAAPFEFVYSVPRLTAAELAQQPPERTLAFRAVAMDAAGNTATADLTVHAVKDRPPVIREFKPANQSTVVDGATVLLSALASDDVDVRSVQFLVDGVSVALDNVLPYTQPYQLPVGLVNKEVEFKAIAKDSAGQTTEMVNRVKVVADAPPKVELDLPFPGTLVFDGDLIVLEANATDDVGIERVEFFVNGKLVDTTLNKRGDFGQFDAQRVFRGEFRAPVASEGNLFEIYAIAYDSRGHSSRSASVVIGKMRDTTAPVVSIIDPVAGDVVTEGQRLTITANTADLGGIEEVTFYVDGTEITTDHVPAPGDTLTPYRADYLVPEGRAGEHLVFTARATDPSGNVAFAKPVEVEIGMRTAKALPRELVNGDGDRIAAHTVGSVVRDGMVYMLSSVESGWEFEVLSEVSTSGGLATLGKYTAKFDAGKTITLQNFPCKYATALAVRDNYAYIVWNDGIETWLSILDVTDPHSPAIRSHTRCPGGDGEAIVVQDKLALIANGPAGLLVLDVSDAADPLRVQSVPTAGTARGLVVRGTYAYVAAGTEGVEIVDLAAPSKPIVGRVDTFGSATGIAIQGDHLYVSGDAIETFASPHSALSVIDISVPEAPLLVGRMDYVPARADHRSGGSLAVHVAGSLGMITTEILTQSGSHAKGLLQLVDISDPAVPRVIRRANVGDNGFALSLWNGNVMVAGGVSGLLEIPQQVLSVDSVTPAMGEAEAGLNDPIDVFFSQTIHPDALKDPSTDRTGAAPAGHFRRRVPGPGGVGHGGAQGPPDPRGGAAAQFGVPAEGGGGDPLAGWCAPRGRFHEHVLDGCRRFLAPARSAEHFRRRQVPRAGRRPPGDDRRPRVLARRHCPDRRQTGRDCPHQRDGDRRAHADQLRGWRGPADHQRQRPHDHSARCVRLP